MPQYSPVRIAFNVFEPKYDLDETLNPVIFLHGLGDTKELWHDVPQKISDATKRRCFTIDSRNNGDSEYTKDYSYDINVEDLRYFMNSNGISKAIIIGHSIGGITAGRFALIEPDKVEAVFIEDLHLGPCNRNWVKFAIQQMHLWSDAVGKIPSCLDKSEGIRFAVDYMYSQISPIIEKGLASKESLYNCNFSLKQSDDGSYEPKVNLPPIEKFTVTIEQSSLVPEGTYEGPAFVIYGTLSPFKIYEFEEKIRKSLPKAQFFGIENAHHNVHIEQPDKFIEMVLKCISHVNANKIY